MRGEKFKLRCLWIVPQAVEVKGRIKNRKRWRYLTEQAHTHQYWLNWCLPHESHQFYYVTSRSRGSFWHSVQSSSMSKDIFCRTCEHDLFCSLPPSFSLAESMTTEKKKYHSLNQKACSIFLNRLFNICSIMYCTHYSKSAVVFWCVITN